MDTKSFISIALLTLANLPLITQADVTKTGKNATPIVTRTNAPQRGIRQIDVLKRFGEPRSKHAAIGSPPISSWNYGSYQVYFERDLVLHTVSKQK
jgi:hypothetical protein